MDKVPMSLVHTAGTSLPGKERSRLFCKYIDGQKYRKKYILKQPNVHAIYRRNYSTVDVYNKLTFGPRSLQKPFQVKDWKVRFFFATLAMCETNTFLAYAAA